MTITKMPKEEIEKYKKVMVSVPDWIFIFEDGTEIALNMGWDCILKLNSDTIGNAKIKTFADFETMSYFSNLELPTTPKFIGCCFQSGNTSGEVPAVSNEYYKFPVQLVKVSWEKYFDRREVQDFERCESSEYVLELELGCWTEE